MFANIVGPDGLIIVVALVVVLLFGGKKLPSLARGLGSASHEFKKGIEHGDPESEVPEVHVAVLPPAHDVATGERMPETVIIKRDSDTHRS